MPRRFAATTSPLAAASHRQRRGKGPEGAPRRRGATAASKGKAVAAPTNSTAAIELPCRPPLRRPPLRRPPPSPTNPPSIPLLRPTPSDPPLQPHRLSALRLSASHWPPIGSIHHLLVTRCVPRGVWCCCAGLWQLRKLKESQNGLTSDDVKELIRVSLPPSCFPSAHTAVAAAAAAAEGNGRAPAAAIATVGASEVS